MFAAALALTLCTSQTALAQSRPTITSQDLAALRALHSLRVSPDGAWAAFQVVQADATRNRYDAAWYVAAIGGSASVSRIADAGQPAPAGPLGITGVIGGHWPAPAPVWSPDSEWIAFLVWDGKRSQIWRGGRRGGRAEQLTFGQRNVRELTYARDGNRILYQTEPDLSQVNAAHAAEGLTGFLVDERFNPSYDRVPVYPRNADYVAGTFLRRTDGLTSVRQIWILDLPRRRERLAIDEDVREFEALTTRPRPQRERPARGATFMSPDGAFAWLEARDPERQGAQAPLTILVTRGNGDDIACGAPECANQPIRNIWWRREDEIVFERRQGPHQSQIGLYAWHIDSGRVRPILQTTARLSDHMGAIGSSCAMAGTDRLVCFLEETATPRRLVAIHLDTGVLETMHDPNPDFAQFNLGPTTQRLHFRSSSSSHVYSGVLAFPPDHRAGERLPLVIVTYMCSGFLGGGAGDEYPIFPMAGAGLAVLCLDVAEDHERQERLNVFDYQRWYWEPGVPGRQMAIESFSSAIGLLDEMQIIDPNRVGATGLSRGAQLVAWALPALPRIAAGIHSGYPGGVATSYYLVSDGKRREMEDFYGLRAPQETGERWSELSFTPHIDRVRAPLLINAADHEMLWQMEDFVALRDADRAVEMFVYPDEYHWKWQPAHRLAIYNRNIDWMNFWLRGVEDPAPAKAEQYERWRAMRVKQCELFKGDDAPWYCAEK